MMTVSTVFSRGRGLESMVTTLRQSDRGIADKAFVKTIKKEQKPEKFRKVHETIVQAIGIQKRTKITRLLFDRIIKDNTRVILTKRSQVCYNDSQEDGIKKSFLGGLLIMENRDLVVVSGSGALEGYRVIGDMMMLEILDTIDRAPSTIKNYKKIVGLFFTQYGNMAVDGILESMKQFVVFGLPDSTAPLPLNSQRVRKYALKAYFTKQFENAKYMVDAVKDTFKKIKLAREANRAITQDKIFSYDDIDHLLNVVSLTPKQEVIVKLLYETGLRASEAIGIRLDRIREFNDAYYYVKVLGKGNAYRDVLIRRVLVEEINALYEGEVYLFETHRPKSDKITHMSYDSLYRVMKNVEKKASKLGVKINPHKFRHTFATHKLELLSDDGAMLDKISKFLGHKTTAITSDYYVHVGLSSDDLMRADAKKEGLNAKKKGG